MIDRMERRAGPGRCEVCERQPATRRAKFTAQYLQATASAIFEEEGMVGAQMEKRVCEDCLKKLQDAKNVSELTFERL